METLVLISNFIGALLGIALKTFILSVIVCLFGATFKEIKRDLKERKAKLKENG